MQGADWKKDRAPESSIICAAALHAWGDRECLFVDLAEIGKAVITTACGNVTNGTFGAAKQLSGVLHFDFRDQLLAAKVLDLLDDEADMTWRNEKGLGDLSACNGLGDVFHNISPNRLHVFDIMIKGGIRLKRGRRK